MPLPRLASTAQPVEWPYRERPDETWWINDLFRGKAPGVRSFAAHTSILSPGRTTHPPHSHPGEEVCLVLAGALELNVPGLEPRWIRAGQAMFMPANLVHGLTAGDELAVYHIIRWLSDPPAPPPEGRLELAVVDMRADGTRLEGPTDYLEWLRCSVVSLVPGEEEGPRPAPHSCMLAVLDGEVEALGAQLGIGGTAVVCAGDELAVSNRGDTAASFLLVEIEPHRAPFGRRLANDALWYSRRSPLRDPVVES